MFQEEESIETLKTNALYKNVIYVVTNSHIISLKINMVEESISNGFGLKNVDETRKFI